MSYFTDISLRQGTANTDAFSRLRVSELTTLFDSKQIHGDSTIFWDNQLNGSGTSTEDIPNAQVVLGVTNSGDYAIRQTRQTFNYQPGKSQMILMTGLMQPVSGTNKLMGYVKGDTSSPYTVQNGIAFETIDNDMYISVYKGGTATRVIQSSWNIDKLDGTGASGVNIDWSKCQIFFMDFEWLGVGTIRYGVVVDGMIYYVHKQNHANSVISVYAQSPNNSIRYEIRSTGSASTLNHICCSVASEGGEDKTGVVATLDTNSASISTGTGQILRPLIGVRLKGAYLDAVVDVLGISIVATSNANVRWCLCWNPTITGTFNYSDVPGGALQWAIGDGSQAVTSENLKMKSGYFSNNVDNAQSPIVTNLKMGSLIDGTPDEIVLCAESLGASEDLSASIETRQSI